MSVDAAIVEAVRAAVADALGPLEARLAQPAPMTYTAAAAATVIGCSERTVRTLVEQRLLPTVPHIGKRTLIPRRAVERFVHAADPTSLVELERAS